MALPLPSKSEFVLTTRGGERGEPVEPPTATVTDSGPAKSVPDKVGVPVPSGVAKPVLIAAAFAFQAIELPSPKTDVKVIAPLAGTADKVITCTVLVGKIA